MWCLLSSFSLSYKVNIQIYTKLQSYSPKDGDAQILVARSSSRLNFVMCCLIFVVHQCVTYCMPSLWRQNFEVVPILLEHFYIPAL